MLIRWLAAGLVVAGCGLGSAFAGERAHEPPARIVAVHAPESLAHALAAAPEGAILQLDEGEIRERVTVSRAVSIVGRGPLRTRIAGGVVIRGASHVRLQGLTFEGGDVGVVIEGGTGHVLEDVILRGMAQSALVTRGAEVSLSHVEVADIGPAGRAIDVDGGAIAVRDAKLRNGGRRGIQIRAAKGTLERVDVEGSQLSALQVVDGADVHVVGGHYRGMGGAALYAGGAKLSIEGARIESNEFAVVAFRGAELALRNDELVGYRVAAVAMINSRGVVERCAISSGGTEAAISVTGKMPGGGVSLIDNRIRNPGPFGVHVTQAAVMARGNTITGARLDHERDMGDAFFAVDSDLKLEDNVLRGNAGSGVVTIRSTVRLDRNGLIDNGRSGLLLLEASKATATGNYFDRNRSAGVEVSEGAHAELQRNRFGERGAYDIDTGCGRRAGSAELGAGNTFAAGEQRRVCP